MKTNATFLYRLYFNLGFLLVWKHLVNQQLPVFALFFDMRIWLDSREVPLKEACANSTNPAESSHGAGKKYPDKIAAPATAL